MQTMINNYINGNLTDAKRQARRFSLAAIRLALLDRGLRLASAMAIAEYLKGKGTFQAACDAEGARN